MNNKELIAALATRLSLTSKEVQAWVDDTCEVMTAQLVEEHSISIPGVGQFEVKTKMERISVNPTTGKRTLIPPKQVIGFKPSAALKGRYKQGGQGDE